MSPFRCLQMGVWLSATMRTTSWILILLTSLASCSSDEEEGQPSQRDASASDVAIDSPDQDAMGVESGLETGVDADASEQDASEQDAPSEADAFIDAAEGGAADDTGSSDGPVEAGLTVQELLAALENAVCEVRVRCEFDPDQSTCLDEMSKRYGTTFGTLRGLVDSVAAGRILMDGVQAQVCIESIRSLGCGAASDALPEIPACVAAFEGTVAAGGTCIHRAACETGTYCEQTDSDSCVGHCVLVADAPCECSGPQGDPFSSKCSFGQVCSLGAGSACGGAPSTSCVAFQSPGAAGQPCGGNGMCQQGLTCSSGACEPLPDDGCSPLVGCAAPGDVCVLTGSSTQCLEEKHLGESCTYPMECGGFMSNLVCDTGTQTCVNRPAAGSSCVMAGVGSGLGFCDDPTAYCDVSETPPLCRSYTALGSPCTGSDECGPLFDNVKCDSVTHTCVEMPLEVCSP